MQLLTAWCRVLLEKLPGLQLVKKFPAFHGTRRFITALTSVRHLSLSWTSPIQSLYPHPTSWRYPNIIHPSTPRSPHWSLPLRFPQKRPYTPPFLTHMRYTPSPSTQHAISAHNITIGRTSGGVNRKIFPDYTTKKMEQRECAETSAHKIQTQGITQKNEYNNNI